MNLQSAAENLFGRFIQDVHHVSLLFADFPGFGTVTPFGSVSRALFYKE